MQISKAQKTFKSSVTFFSLLGSVQVKAAHKRLVKSISGANPSCQTFFVYTKFFPFIALKVSYFIVNVFQTIKLSYENQISKKTNFDRIDSKKFIEKNRIC